LKKARKKLPQDYAHDYAAQNPPAEVFFKHADFCLAAAACA
jgi:hypothetical protein